ncbi:MAG TPA: zf-HC2 domain-containing protein [Acidimicrobiia bacterium]|nr:zf-HC2 domain-containing protein [Acidimicrobiia bacterium]
MNERPAPDDRLSAYLDGELDLAERQAVESYLAESAEWRVELEEVAWARDALRSLPVREAPPGFWDAALAPQLTEARARRARRVPRIAGLGAAAAAVAAVVTGALVVPSPDRVTPKVPAVADAHAVRASVSDDPVSRLATLSVVTPPRR